MNHNPDIQTILDSACGPRNQHLIPDARKKVKKRKYRNKPCEVDGIKFDSQKEADRYGILKLLLKKGEIGLLELHKPFLLIEENETERKCEYVADFVYMRMDTGRLVVEDTKSEATRKLSTYIMKRKLMKSKYNIEIQEK